MIPRRISFWWSVNVIFSLGHAKSRLWYAGRSKSTERYYRSGCQCQWPLLDNRIFLYTACRAINSGTNFNDKGDDIYLIHTSPSDILRVSSNIAYKKIHRSSLLIFIKVCIEGCDLRTYITVFKSTFIENKETLLFLWARYTEYGTFYQSRADLFLKTRKTCQGSTSCTRVGRITPNNLDIFFT